MRLKLTLVRADGTSDDVVVTADAATTVSDVARTVARVDPRARRGADGPAPAASPTLQAQLPGQERPVLLPPEAPIGEAWIGSGAVVAVLDGSGASPARVGEGGRPGTGRVGVRVVSGPDAGLQVELPEGSFVVGRAPDCDVRLSDPLVSKRHARLEVGRGVELVDLGSANGLEVDGGIVQRVPVDGRQLVTVGDSVLAIEVRAGTVLAGVEASAGPVPFNRSPRVEPRYAGVELKAPEAPPEEDDAPFPFLALLAPILLGGAMYLMTHRVTSLLFVLLTPIMLVGNHLTEGRRRRAKRARAVARYDERLTGLRAALERESAAEVEGRLAEAPSTAETLEQAVRRGPMLWTRRPEHWSFLNVRLGQGAMTSRTTVEAGGRGDLLPEYQAQLDELLERYRTVPGVPVVENLHDAGALGLAGPPTFTLGSLDALLVQLTALHSPAELVLTAIVSPAWTQPLEWLSWLPHTGSPQSPVEGPHLADSPSSAQALLAELEEIVAQRLAGAGGAAQRGAVGAQDAALDRGASVGEKVSTNAAGAPGRLPAVVVVVTDDAGVDRARLTQLAELGADAGVYPIWVSPSVERLPGACRTYLAFDEAGRASVGLVRLGERIEDVDVSRDVVGTRGAAEYARRMAPVHDAGALVADESDLPRTVALVSLLGHDVAEAPDAVVDRWRQNQSIHDRTPVAVGARPVARRRAGGLRAIVGSAGVDAMQLDLRSQGPHALVGGTTGSGKSEFLQAWVLGLAAEYSPDRVTFLFVDYKGGAAFADCVRLPHCVGLVTDLSPHLVRRALTSLRAELHHREHLLSRKKAKDLLELEKRGDPDCPPALVIVIDEFAALVGEVPEFVDGVVDVAQRGRSLGIHLIMATQRPAGVIRDNLRANTNLRVALRMADENDSVDVVDTKDAAHFDPSLPGRALAKSGPGRLQVFQSAYAGGWTSREPDRLDVEVAELRFGGELRWEEPEPAKQPESDELGPTDQQRLVDAAVAASRLARIPEPRRPWLDELAGTYDLTKLHQRTDTELVLGVADLPARQAQQPVYFVPDVDGHLGVYGTSGAGKSTVLRTLAAAAGITPRGGPVQVYALDFGAGSLRMLDALPHVGAVVGGDDTERVVGLLRMLGAELDRRSEAFAERAAASITDYRRLADAPGTPRILLLVDNLPEFRDQFEAGAGRAQWFDVFRDVLSRGRQLGVHVAFTADRSGAVPTYVRSFVPRNLVLRLADDGYVAFGAPKDVLSASSPAGRAVLDGEEVQVAVLGGTTAVSEQAEATARLGAAMRRNGVADAPPVRVLPPEYGPAELPAALEGRPVLGLDAVTLGPVGFEPEGVLLVAGPPASGRTNALASVVTAVLRADPDARTYFVGPARSTLAGLDLWADRALTVEQAQALATDLLAAVQDEDTEGRVVVVVESLGDYLQTPADRALVELTKAVRASGHLLVAEAETSAWSASWPLFAEVKNARRGLLLQPDPLDSETVLRTPTPRAPRSEFPVGRGVWVARGRSERVQVPLVLEA